MNVVSVDGGTVGLFEVRMSWEEDGQVAKLEKDGKWAYTAGRKRQNGFVYVITGTAEGAIRLATAGLDKVEVQQVLKRTGGYRTTVLIDRDAVNGLAAG